MNYTTTDQEEKEYDKHVDFYYTNLINSIILFSLTTDELEKLEGTGFDPIFELEAEIDYAFTPVCFETVFRNERVDFSLKPELLEFKQETDDIPGEIWDWDFIENHKTWITIRHKANNLLNKLNVKSRIYNDDFITIYDSDGNLLKKGKKM